MGNNGEAVQECNRVDKIRGIESERQIRRLNKKKHRDEWTEVEKVRRRV